MTTRPKLYKPNSFKSGKSYSGSKPRNARKSGYDKDWDKYRFRFLHHNPQCYACSAKATVVDHIVAHKGDPVLFKKLDNHLPLCSPCHNHITARFDRHATPMTEEKIKYLHEQRKSLNITTKVKVLPSYP